MTGQPSVQRRGRLPVIQNKIPDGRTASRPRPKNDKTVSPKDMNAEEDENRKKRGTHLPGDGARCKNAKIHKRSQSREAANRCRNPQTKRCTSFVVVRGAAAKRRIYIHSKIIPTVLPAQTSHSFSSNTSTSTSIMGMVFGIQREEEPSYTVLLDRTSTSTGNIHTPYEIRQYGTRYAIEAAFENSNGDNQDETRSPFMKLAGYIVVMSDPQNEGKEGIAMTAPVAMQRERNGHDTAKKGEKIAMTAPVAMHREGNDKDAASSGSTKKMQFFLPSKYDSLDKIPAPT